MKSVPQLFNNEPLINPMFGRFFRFLVFLFMILAVWLGKAYGTPSIIVQCLNDPLHNILQIPNEVIISNREYAQFLQISSSLLMDFTFFSLFTFWFLYGKSSRLILATSMFYVIRAISQILVQFKFPEGYDWQYPGFPSYVVPYGNTSDFFFSGHCGFLNMCALEWFALGKRYMGFTVEAFNVYMVMVMLIFRVHYTIGLCFFIEFLYN